MTDLLLTNAVMITVDPQRRILYNGAMAVSGDRIQAVGDSAELLRQYPDAKRIIDCGQKLVFPGFINTHNHLFQTLLKGLGDDMVLKDWLRTMTFPAARFLEPEDCWGGAMLGILEGIHSGMVEGDRAEAVCGGYEAARHAVRKNSAQPHCPRKDHAP